MGVGNDADNSNAGDGWATSLGRIIIIIAAVDATNDMGGARSSGAVDFGNDADSGVAMCWSPHLCVPCRIDHIHTALQLARRGSRSIQLYS